MNEDDASGALVEALVRKLRPAGAFRKALLQAGVDPAQVAEHYSGDQWNQVLQLSRKHAFADLPDDDAYRQLGRVLIDGFLATPTGALLASALPVLSPQAFLAKTPFFVRLGRSDVTVTVGATRQPVRLTLHDPHSTSGFVCAGLLEHCLERLGVAPAVTVVVVNATRYHLDVRWQ